METKGIATKIWIVVRVEQAWGGRNHLYGQGMFTAAALNTVNFTATIIVGPKTITVAQKPMTAGSMNLVENVAWMRI